jgi:hypothetical protein
VYTAGCSDLEKYVKLKIAVLYFLGWKEILRIFLKDIFPYIFRSSFLFKSTFVTKNMKNSPYES